MKLLYYAWIFILGAIQIGICEEYCEVMNKRTAVIDEYYRDNQLTEKCWSIPVPQDSYLRLSLNTFNFQDSPCDEVYLKIFVEATGEMFTFCSGNLHPLPKVLTILSDVEISTSLKSLTIEKKHGWQVIYENQPVYFNLSFTTENIICAQNNHFRCSADSCVYQHQVCNGVYDCGNGKDEEGCATGVAAVSGVNVTRDRLVERIKYKRSTEYGWGENTHRAITALYLSGKVHFQDDNLEEELMEKELVLKILEALLRNSTEILEVADLSMFINALSVTCHNPRQFYGYNLLQILSDQVANAETSFPGASLTLCNSNWTLPESTLRNLLKLLQEESEYPFIQDIQATAMMALTCSHKKTNSLENITNATEAYNAMIEKFIAGQMSDGSFGNVFTTALITQALLSSGQESNSKWNVTATIKHLMHHLHVPVDPLATYLVLPILNGKSLVDLSDVTCGRSRKTRSGEVSNLTNKSRRKVQIQYTLYVGDLKDVIHTIYLKVPEKSTAYDVMKLAEINDVKYKFLYRHVGSNLYVYKIAGIFNDPETLKFWLLYITDPSNDGEINHSTKSPDKLIVRDGQHLIMWYKTVPMWKTQEVKTEDIAKDETGDIVKDETEDEIGDETEDATSALTSFFKRKNDEKRENI